MKDIHLTSVLAKKLFLLSQSTSKKRKLLKPTNKFQKYNLSKILFFLFEYNNAYYET